MQVFAIPISRQSVTKHIRLDKNMTATVTDVEVYCKTSVYKCLKYAVCGTSIETHTERIRLIGNRNQACSQPDAGDNIFAFHIC